MSSVTFLVIFFYNGSLIFLHNLHIISKFLKNIRTICFSRQNIKDTLITRWNLAKKKIASNRI